ncbi:MAG TPA: DUF5994 family protein [Micromonosporaceae bacterium]|nr:DUF5994 family protein [Micromonosporaceae bacterium]
MTTTTTRRATIVPPSSPSTPRVCLGPARASQAVLDGGWWPRSADPVAELPGLVLALGERYGSIRQMMLSSHTWDSRPRRVAVGTQVVRLGWFATVDPALAIATTEHGDQLDLLVVPAPTAEAAARDAMRRAADPTNTMRAPDLLAAVLDAVAQPQVAAADKDADAGSAWDNEGGHHVEDRRPWAARRYPTASSS